MDALFLDITNDSIFLVYKDSLDDWRFYIQRYTFSSATSNYNLDYEKDVDTGSARPIPIQIMAFQSDQRLVIPLAMMKSGSAVYEFYLGLASIESTGTWNNPSQTTSNKISYMSYANDVPGLGGRSLNEYNDM